MGSRPGRQGLLPEPTEALAQIEEKGYARPYEAGSREVVRVGVSFSSEERNIVEWKTA